VAEVGAWPRVSGEVVAIPLQQPFPGVLALLPPGADAAVLDDMALNFGGALLLEMERVGLAKPPTATWRQSMPAGQCRD
jgi:hypothetical protein